jgi:hypothetical protein
MSIKISVSVKHSDLASLIIEKDSKVVLDHDGYMLPILGISDDGDYTSFEVDNETGKIIGWKPLTDKDIKKLKVLSRED